MKTFLPFLLLLLVTLTNPFRSLHAQQQDIESDTLSLSQTSYTPAEFVLNDTLINRILIQTSKVQQMNDVKYKLGGEVLRSALTIATGIGFGNAKEVDWYLATAIRTNNPNLDWILDVYCPGYIEKERTRVKNDDGSYSVETNYVNKFLWQEGALGYIIEKGDTVGWHYVQRSPRADTALQLYLQTVYKGKQQPAPFNYTEFALLGEFTGIVNAILYNSEENRLYIFSGNELSGIFQCVKPPVQLFFRLKKKALPQPYMLVNTKLTAWERMDLLRLAMVGLRMKSAVESF